MKSMRFVIQRVTEATCEVDQKITGQITNGFCVLIGIAETDTKNIADKMIRKLLGMRIFQNIIYAAHNVLGAGQRDSISQRPVTMGGHVSSLSQP